MLSILIPVYNYTIISLIEKLNQELTKNNDIIYEIICLDDASNNIKTVNNNKRINKLKNCSYEILSINIGRSKIRNTLAQKAKYENLIFLDSDVIPVKVNFAQNYLNVLESFDVIYGGINYPEVQMSLHKSLHYIYGKKREAKLYEKRKNNFNSFTSANFAIKKSVFEKVIFNECIKTYGFEDLLFAKNLISERYKIKQIDNSVIHNGIIENNEDFILKEQESIKTLSILNKNGFVNQKDVKLLYYFNLLKKTKTTQLYNIFFKSFKKGLIKNLTSKTPSLFLFDLYRLGYFNSLFI